MPSSEWRRSLRKLLLSYKPATPFTRRLLKELEKPSRRRRELNLGQLERVAKPGEVVFVPGKVLGGGIMRKKLTVGAFAFSAAAYRRIGEVGGEALTLAEFLSRYGSGTGVRLVG
ncbi:MAG: 50S ribosomal protein L18e [Nitrososphaerota archaeon]